MPQDEKTESYRASPYHPDNHLDDCSDDHSGERGSVSLTESYKTSPYHPDDKIESYSKEETDMQDIINSIKEMARKEVRQVIKAYKPKIKKIIKKKLVKTTLNQVFPARASLCHPNNKIEKDQLFSSQSKKSNASLQKKLPSLFDI